MKKYLLFGGDKIANGGWNDFVGDYDTIDEAKDAALEQRWQWDWAHIIDRDTKELIQVN